MTTRERREARADRLREWADKRDEKAAAADQKARSIADMIPMGQPILVGHHSEGRHRRDIARIENGFARAYEHSKKADDMRSRAAGIESQLDHSIYSDVADALERLAERIAELEAERDRIKAYNASCRKAAKNGGTGDLSILNDRERDEIATLARVCAYSVGPGGSFPSYHLTNLSANIKRNRDRIEQVQRRQARAERTEQAGGTLIEQLGHGYARVTFAEKPDRAVIAALKDAGYRWGQGSWTGKADQLPAEVQS